MTEYLIIGFLASLIAHYHYLIAVHRVQLEIDLHKSKRQSKRRERKRVARKQLTKRNNNTVNH